MLEMVPYFEPELSQPCFYNSSGAVAKHCACFNMSVG